MTDLATLSLSIDSRPAAEAASAIDQLAQAATRGEGRVSAITSATDALVAALNRNTTATSALSTVLAQVEVSGGRARTALTSVSAASETATDNVVRLTAATTATRVGFDAAAASSTKLRAAWADLSAQGSSTLQNVERMQKLAAASASTPGFTPANQNARGGPSNYQNQILQDIAFQGKDFFEQSITGGSPIRAALTQAPQVAALMQMGNLGVGDVVSGFADKFKGIGATAILAAQGIGAAGAAVGGLATALGVGAAAFASYKSAQEATERSLYGIGRASGATVGDINQLSKAAAAGNMVSVGSAREAANTFAATGRITGDMYLDLIRASKDYAFTTGTDAVTANSALAAAFADPTKGAETLNAQLGLLDASTEQTIRRLDAQGDRLGAQKALFAALSQSVENADAKLGFFGRQWQQFTANTSREVEGIGAFVDRGLGGGTAEERLAALQGQAAFRQRNKGTLGGMFDGLLDYDNDTIRSQIADVQKEIDEARQKSDRAQTAQRSQSTAALLRTLMPEQQALQTLQDQADKLRRAISDPLKFGLDAPALANTESAFERIARSVRTMTDDVEKFGTSATAALVRSAEYGNRMVGATSLGRGVGDAQQTYDEAVRRAGLDPKGRSSAAINADYTARLSDSNLDVKDARGLVAAREAEMRNARELEGLQRVRDLSIDSAGKTESLSLNQQGGAFSRLPTEVQQQFLRAAQNPRYAGIPVGIAAAITSPESGGNLDIGFSKSLGEDGRRSSAYGLGQITAGTAREAAEKGYLPADYDRMNRDTMAEGILGVLSMKRDQNGGDLTRAIMAYRGSTDPSVNRLYAAGVMRDAGQMGDASSLGLVRDQDANRNALSQANDSLKNITENYGRNAVALEANGRAQDQYRQLIERGIPAAQAASIAFDGLQTKVATAGLEARAVQFGRDNEFARAQLGRDQYDQQAYTAARPFVGTPDEGKVLTGARDLAVMTDTRRTLTDSMGGFVTALSHGTSAADAAASALGRLGDKLIGTATDALVGSLFKGAGGAGGGDLLGGIGKLFGFANGGVMTSAGALPLHRYATGGIASSPQLALFGEGRGPEAFVPLPDGRSIPVQMRAGGSQAQSASNQGPQAPSVIHQYDLRGSTLSEAQVQSAIKQAVASNNTERDRTQFSRANFDRRAFG